MMNKTELAKIILPCAHCGSNVDFVYIDDPESTNQGGSYIECQNKSCRSTSALVFGEDADLALITRWNKRANNPQPETKPDPVGTVISNDGEFFDIEWNCTALPKLVVGTNIYAEPPQREPLSDDELNELVCDHAKSDIWAFARAVENAHGIK